MGNRIIENPLAEPIVNKSKFMTTCETDQNLFPFDSECVYGLGYAIKNKQLHFVAPKFGVSDGLTATQLRGMIDEYTLTKKYGMCPEGCRMNDDKLYVKTATSKPIIVHLVKLDEWITELKGIVYLIEDGLPGTRGQKAREYEQVDSGREHRAVTVGESDRGNAKRHWPGRVVQYRG